MQVKENEVIGAVKIKDGLFMGDVYASQDLELLITNKITHIVNCSGRELPNHWESLGVAYLTLTWQETDYQVLFEGRIDVVGQISKFIELALSRGESVLVHSLRGQNRACCAIAAYCMKKYKWTLYKTLEFLQSKKPNMAIRPNFFSQLMNFENKIAQSGQTAQTYNWNEISNNAKNIDSDELLVTNTFLNSKALPQADFTNLTEREYRPNKLTWIDQAASSDPKASLAVTLSPKKKDKEQDSSSVGSNMNRDEEGKPYVKSILKGSDKVFYLTPSRKESPSKDAAKENKDMDSSTLGRKIKTKLRPGSAIISTGKSQLLKSSSTPMFERPLLDVRGTGLQATMNQLSANREMSKSPKGTVSSAAAKDELKIKKDKKSRLSQSASSKDFAAMLNSPSFIQSSALFENNGDMRAMIQREDNLLGHSLSGKAAANPVPSYRSGLSKHNEKVVRRPGQTLKGFRLDELKLHSNGRSAAIYSSNTGMLKYLSKTTGAKTVNELDVSKNPGNFLPRNKKELQRPMTAPNKREMQDSPYYYAGNYFPSSKQFKEQTKLGSLSANREIPKAFSIKSKVKGHMVGEDDHYDIMDFLGPVSVSSKTRFQS